MFNALSVKLQAMLVFSISLVLLGCSPQTEEIPPADTHFIDTATAQKQLANGSLTSVALVQHYLNAVQILLAAGLD